LVERDHELDRGEVAKRGLLGRLLDDRLEHADQMRRPFTWATKHVKMH